MNWSCRFRSTNLDANMLNGKIHGLNTDDVYTFLHIQITKERGGEGKGGEGRGGEGRGEGMRRDEKKAVLVYC